MNNDEAKFILRAYRPNGGDASDALFGPALEQARQDPDLARWLERQQKFDRAVAAKLGEINPPPDLRAAILAGAGVSQRSPRQWWNQPTWLAVAAGLLIIFSLGLATFWGTRADANDTLPVFATDYVSGGFFLKRHDANVNELRAWLAAQNAPLPKEIPAGFSRLRSLGCKTLDYRGKDVSLICFGEGKEYHLFVARRDDFPMMPANAVPQFLVRKGYASAAWADDKNQYVVVTEDSLQALKECLHCTDS
jgi:hypothetical protein